MPAEAKMRMRNVGRYENLQRISKKKQENYSKFWEGLYKYAAVGKHFFIENCNSLIKITKQSNP